jgi:type I restriction enzyme, S subunit
MSETVLLSEIADVNPESLGAGTPADHEFRYIDLSSVKEGSIDWSLTSMQRFVTAPSRARRQLRTGDFLFGTVRPALRSHAAFPGNGDPCVASTGFAVVRARPGVSNRRFIAQFLLSDFAARQARQLEVGSNYPAVNEADVRRFVLPRLPLDEQGRIAEILDTVDEAIRSTQYLMIKREQLLSGLAAELFASVSEYATVSLASICQFFDDGDWIEAPYITDEGIRLIQTGNVGIGKYLDKVDRQRFISSRTFDLLRCTAVFPTDLLVCRLADPVGRACEVPESMGPAITSVDCSIVRVAPGRADRRYVLHWMNTDRWLAAADRVAGGSTRKRISRSNLGRLEIPMPPIDEQARIGAVIDACRRDLDLLAQEEAKLEHVRSGLVTDVLSGQIRTGES